METFTLDKDITVFYVTAKSFPEGIQEAHQKLHSIVPFSTERQYFGVSRPESSGTIVYRAGVEEMEQGEAEKYDCEALVLKKGKYISITVNNFRKDVMSIGRAFEKLMKHPNLDPQGYCVEWYFSDEVSVQCMIRLNQ